MCCCLSYFSFVSLLIVVSMKFFLVCVVFLCVVLCVLVFC